MAAVRGEYPVWIPEITDERLEELAGRIKPVVRKDEVPYYIQEVDLRGIAYTWDPVTTEKAVGLEPVCDITTYHTYGHYMLFKPSVAEVLAQIPDEHVELVVAFEIVGSPQDANDLNREHEATDAGYHVANTRLYRSVTVAEAQ